MACIGLLFVSISIAPQRTVLASAPIEARVMSSSAFLALLNGFGKGFGSDSMAGASPATTIHERAAAGVI